jgi:hypothetical protein
MPKNNRVGAQEAQDLDSLNAKMRRKKNAVGLIEATIESKAKERGRVEAAAKAGSKRSG